MNYGYDSLKDVSSNYYIHLAGKAHDLKNVSDTEAYFEANYELTKLVFKRFLSDPNSKKFFYLSSVKAVSDTVKNKLLESTPYSPKTEYGKSKMMAEKYILDNLPSNKEVFILRPCMIHGPENKGNLNLLFQIVKKGIPWPLASFENKRSLLSVENLIFVILSLIQNPNIESGVYNIADDEPISTNELISIISESIGKNKRMIKIPPGLIKIVARFGDLLFLPLNSERLMKLTESYIVDNSKIKAALNLENLPISTIEGLKITIKSF
jgi:nucleoside-diphosphate-sugar epimerase